jgi:hypothetical protein
MFICLQWSWNSDMTSCARSHKLRTLLGTQVFRGMWRYVTGFVIPGVQDCSLSSSWRIKGSKENNFSWAVLTFDRCRWRGSSLEILWPTMQLTAVKTSNSALCCLLFNLVSRNWFYSPLSSSCVSCFHLWFSHHRMYACAYSLNLFCFEVFALACFMLMCLIDCVLCWWLSSGFNCVLFILLSDTTLYGL